MLKIFLRAGVDINIADYDDRTPLHVAGDNGSDVIYQILIESGADANKKDIWGKIPLLQKNSQHRKDSSIIGK